jgi:hypothetical protein
MRYKRNLKVFHNILISVCIIIVCGTPFVVSIIINAISKTPWMFYSIIVLSISLAISLESIVLFFTTKGVKEIFYAKIGYRRLGVKTRQLRKTDQIIIIESQIKRNETLPTQK